MKMRLALPALLLLTMPALAADSAIAASPAAVAFERLKTLVGQWDGETSMGKFHLSYELLSGGHVLLEKESSDSMHETMVTTYYLNGDQLELRHYCELGNIPRMVARKIDLQSGEFGFEFADAANLGSSQTAHMHAATIRILDADHLTSSWTMFENARPKYTVAAQYTRVR